MRVKRKIQVELRGRDHRVSQLRRLRATACPLPPHPPTVVPPNPCQRCQLLRIAGRGSASLDHTSGWIAPPGGASAPHWIWKSHNSTIVPAAVTGPLVKANGSAVSILQHQRVVRISQPSGSVIFGGGAPLVRQRIKRVPVRCCVCFRRPSATSCASSVAFSCRKRVDGETKAGAVRQQRALHQHVRRARQGRHAARLRSSSESHLPPCSGRRPLRPRQYQPPRLVSDRPLRRKSLPANKRSVCRNGSYRPRKPPRAPSPPAFNAHAKGVRTSAEPRRCAR